MTRSIDLDLDAGTELERRLFESARSDPTPAGETERAWQRFAARAGMLAPLTLAASAPPVWWRSARVQALKWTLLGAIGGGSLVAVWLGPAQPAPVPVVALPAQRALVHVVAPPPAVALPAEGVVVPPAGAVEPVALAAPPQLGARAAAGPAQRRELRTATPSARSQRRLGTALAEASLAREVAALDAARTALAVGANASALRQIEQYHRDFPAGELAADADVVAIEALAAEGDRARCQRAAERFLERRPHDPHGARVRALLQQLGATTATP